MEHMLNTMYALRISHVDLERYACLASLNERSNSSLIFRFGGSAGVVLVEEYAAARTFVLLIARSSVAQFLDFRNFVDARLPKPWVCPILTQ